MALRNHFVRSLSCMVIIVVSMSPHLLYRDTTPDKQTAANARSDVAHTTKPAQEAESPSSLPGFAYFERITTSDGLSYPVVRDIIQDQQGYMWFATDAGIDRYDGYDFTSYLHDPDDPASLRYDIVRAVHEDSHGNIWVGHGGGLDRMDRAAGTFEHLYTAGQVFCIAEDRDGTIWIGTWRGLYGFDSVSGSLEYSYQHYSIDPGNPRSISDNYINAVYADQEGSIWVGSINGLDRLNKVTGTFTRYRHDPDDPNSLSDNVITSILEDSQGRLWIGTVNGGLNLFNPDTGAFNHFKHDPDDPDSLSHNTVITLLEDHTGQMWVGTWNGLNQLDQSHDRFTHYYHDANISHSLSDNFITALYEDRSGVLWVGTANGISKRLERASHFTLVPEFVDSKINTIYEDPGGRLWAGTTEGLFWQDPGADDFSAFPHSFVDDPALGSEEVTAVFEDHTGILWVAMGSGELIGFDTQTELVIHRETFDHSISTITEDLAGNLWLGIGFNDGLYWIGSDRTRPFHHIPQSTRPDGLSHGNITALHVDRHGALWVGTLGGVHYLENPDDLSGSAVQFTKYQHESENPNSLSHNRVHAFYEDPESGEGTMWIGTAGGLDRLDLNTQTFTHYTVEDGLPDNVVNCIVPGTDGYLWIGTPKGLSRFDRQTGSFYNYDERDGLSGFIGLGGLRTQIDALYFNGYGLMAVDAEPFRINEHVPLIVITTLSIHNTVVRTETPAGEHIQLTYQDNSLTFEFSSLDFTQPEKNQYAYMLDGLDENWIYAGTRRYADYRNIPPGDYVFRVRGSNNDGVWNEEGIAVNITIAPPFWRTGWFIGIITMLLLGGAFGVYRSRIRRIEHRSRELEEQVEIRTAELQREIQQRLKAEEALRESETEKAVAEERGRLARELHDSVTQALYSSTLVAEAGHRLAARGAWDEVPGYLANLRDLAQQALREMRLLVYELRPLDLSETGCVGAIQQRLDAVERRGGIEARIDVEGDVDGLPPRVVDNLYRIAQEALNNALKHAAPTRVTVSIQVEDGTPLSIAMLEIHDNGAGFIPDDVSDKGGVGLASMRERMARLGGSLTIRSTPGEGTLVRARVEVDT